MLNLIASFSSVQRFVVTMQLFKCTLACVTVSKRITALQLHRSALILTVLSSVERSVCLWSKWLRSVQYKSSQYKYCTAAWYLLQSKAWLFLWLSQSFNRLGDWAFSSASRSHWNSLPKHICEFTNLKLLKTHPFSNCN